MRARPRSGGVERGAPHDVLKPRERSLGLRTAWGAPRYTQTVGALPRFAYMIFMDFQVLRTGFPGLAVRARMPVSASLKTEKRKGKTVSIQRQVLLASRRHPRRRLRSRQEEEEARDFFAPLLLCRRTPCLWLDTVKSCFR